MASRGIKDRVAIVGMGCTNFGEQWDKSTDDLLIESTQAAMASAKVTRDDIDAYWLGTMGSGTSGLTLSKPLRLENKPVTRLENMCATGSEALRNACYAVASGAFDMAMAVGVEKLKDSGYSGLVSAPLPSDGTLPETTAPARFSFLAPAYAKKYGVDPAELKDVSDSDCVEEPLQRGARSARTVPQGGVQGRHLPVHPDRRDARRVRLLGRVRWFGGGRRSAARKTPTATPTSRST